MKISGPEHLQQLVSTVVEGILLNETVPKTIVLLETEMTAEANSVDQQL